MIVASLSFEQHLKESNLKILKDENPFFLNRPILFHFIENHSTSLIVLGEEKKKVDENWKKGLMICKAK